MRDLAVLVLHLLTTIARLAGPGGARSLVAESVFVKQQSLILNLTRKRAPNLRLPDRVVAGLCALLMRPTRLVRSAIVLKPAMLFRLHQALKTRKYRLLFSSAVHKKPGPRGPSRDVVAALIDMKRRNPTWGCPRIAQQIALAFDIPINKDVCGAFSPRGTDRSQTSWAILAHGARAREGQPVESRLVSVRIGNLADALGTRRHGPLHASDRGLWRASRRRRRRRAVSHVQSSDARSYLANLRQLGPSHDVLFASRRGRRMRRVLLAPCFSRSVCAHLQRGPTSSTLNSLVMSRPLTPPSIFTCRGSRSACRYRALSFTDRQPRSTCSITAWTCSSAGTESAPRGDLSLRLPPHSTGPARYRSVRALSLQSMLMDWLQRDAVSIDPLTLPASLWFLGLGPTSVPCLNCTHTDRPGFTASIDSIASIPDMGSTFLLMLVAVGAVMLIKRGRAGVLI